MKKIIFITLLISSQWAFAQKYKSTTGSITFFSEEVLEDITAVNEKVKSVFDIETGQIVFSLPISGFVFDKSLMQEHFNEKYMESEKYPKSTFSGKLTGYEIGRDNPEVWAEGDLEIHGVKKKIKVKGSLNFTGDKAKAHSVFMVKLVDYEIEVPSLMFQKIAEEIEVTLDIEYKPYEK